jgi:hypothetical protein
MSPNDLTGRRVRVIAWEHLNRVAYSLRRTRQYGDSLEGTVTHVEGFADGDDEGDVWVKIDGLAREYVFGLYQLEVLPLAEGVPSVQHGGQDMSRAGALLAPLSDQSDSPSRSNRMSRSCRSAWPRSSGSTARNARRPGSGWPSGDGVYRGRQPCTTKGQPDRARELQAKGLSSPEFAQALGVSPGRSSAISRLPSPDRPAHVRRGGSSNPSRLANSASARSIRALGVARHFSHSLSSQARHSRDPRMEMMLGNAPRGAGNTTRAGSSP